ncbi:MAG: hypothetical protein ACE5FU_13695, partial [Nitrospinota bacterium]
KRKRAEEAKLLLQSRADERHVDIIDWLILDMRFDPQLERKIKNVKLAGLDELLNIAKEKAVEQRGITQTIDATTEALSEKIQSDKDGKIVALNAKMVTKVTSILAGANKFMIEKKAEGDLYKEERRAAGELLVARAKAEGERLRRKAMTGLGGDLIVALEAARNINLDDIIVSTQDIDLLDIDKMIHKLGGKIEEKSLREHDAKVELRKKSEREDFFKIPRKMPSDLGVPDDLETEFKTSKPKVSDEGLKKEIEEEWSAFVDEEQSSEETKKKTEASSTETPEEVKKEMEGDWKGSVKEYPVSQ